jgi:hypothetical protein
VSDPAVRRCPYEGCTKRIGRELFACSRHWFTLPPDVREEINRAWRAYSRGNGTLDALTAAHERAYTAWGQT